MDGESFPIPQNWSTNMTTKTLYHGSPVRIRLLDVRGTVVRCHRFYGIEVSYYSPALRRLIKSWWSADQLIAL